MGAGVRSCRGRAAGAARRAARGGRPVGGVRGRERRRIVAAWEALERAADLLPDGHPAAPHVGRALAALEDEWRAALAARDASDTPERPAVPRPVVRTARGGPDSRDGR